MGVREEHLLKRIFDRQMDIHSGYLVYFDDVCMNEFVESYVTNVGISVGQSSASVTLTYAPQFKSIATMDDAEAYFDSEDGIQNGTSLRIFGENVFSKKYHILFDGIIKSRSFSRNPQGFSLVFSATDFMYWLSRSIIPITIPATHSIYPGERIRWKGQGVFVDDLSVVNAVTAGQLIEKTITEYWNDVLKKSLVENSTVYSDENSVAVFDDAVNRVSILGDINPVLFSQQVIDLVLTANALFTDTAYVALNNVTSKLLMEFFQDIDGVIKVKPPFWNEPVLKNYIIDPIMIKSGSEGTNWDSFYTRVISQGGKEEWEPGATEDENAMFTPIGVFVGEYKNKNGGQWADYMSYGGIEQWNDGQGGDTTPYITGSDGESLCLEYLKSNVANIAVICGIMANIFKESTFNSTSENGLAYGLFQWTYDKNDRKNPSRRMSLWKTAENYAIYEAFPGGYDKNAEGIYAATTFQLMYFLMDIGYMNKSGYFVAPPKSGYADDGYGDGYDIVGSKLKECPNTVEGAKRAADIICRYYEIPGTGSALDAECQKRGDIAAQYYDAYNMKKASDSAGSSHFPLSDSRIKHYNSKIQGNVKVAGRFTVNDVKCKCGKCQDVYIAEPLLHILGQIEADIKAKVVITSAYRCPSHNGSDQVGGSSNSLHKSGAAIDFQYVPTDNTPSYAQGSNNVAAAKNLYRHIKDNYKTKYGYNGQRINECIYYPSQNFIHIGITQQNTDKYFSENGGQS